MKKPLLVVSFLFVLAPCGRRKAGRMFCSMPPARLSRTRFTRSGLTSTTSASQRSDQLPVHRFGRRNPPASGRHRRFRRLGRPDDAMSSSPSQNLRFCISPRSWRVVPTYNVPGVRGELNFTQKALAGIYLGTITKWNDPEIAKANPGVKLAERRHRRRAPLGRQRHHLHLDRFSLEGQRRVETKLGGHFGEWPVGLGGKGNEGVTGLVKQTPGSIGYVELIYAVQNNIPYGKVQNAAGKFVKADLGRRHCGRRWRRKGHAGRFPRFHHQCPGRHAYPISSFTWLLIPAQIHGCSEARCHQGLPEVDADRRPGLQRRPVLRQAAQARRRKGMKAIASNSVV